MGRESEATATFQGETGYVLALLEPAEIILRRELKARIPRAKITGWSVEGDDLVIATGQGPLRLGLGAKEAGAWARALARPLPTLAEKLGLGPDAPVFLSGQGDGAELDAALAGHVVPDVSAARIIIARLTAPEDLGTALALAAARPDLPVWCVYPKGKGAQPSDSDVRAAFRGAGWIDTKNCAVSDRLTATRYVRKSKHPG
jgi:hypothetical protein